MEESGHSQFAPLKRRSLLWAVPAQAGEAVVDTLSGVSAKPKLFTLRSREIPEGFLMLFDGPDKIIEDF